MPPRLLDEPERALADLREDLAKQGALASRLLGPSAGHGGRAASTFAESTVTDETDGIPGA